MSTCVDELLSRASQLQEKPRTVLQLFETVLEMAVKVCYHLQVILCCFQIENKSVIKNENMLFIIYCLSKSDLVFPALKSIFIIFIIFIIYIYIIVLAILCRDLDVCKSFVELKGLPQLNIILKRTVPIEKHLLDEQTDLEFLICVSLVSLLQCLVFFKFTIIDYYIIKDIFQSNQR